MTDLFDIRDRVVVVTGASSGLGEHFAEMLSARGARVVAAARRQERLDELCRRHPDIVGVRCDVTDAADRERLVGIASEQTGRIDVLVNNAGTGDSAPATEMSVAQFESSIALNLTSVFALSSLVGARMVEAGQGSIVSIASILGLVAAHPIPHAAYTAAKGGVVNLTRQLGCEWARHGVRVNAIAPAWFPTEVTADMFDDERSMNYIRRNTPMGRPGRVEELDGAMLLLATDAGSYITGQTIVVDGGWTAR
jgi:NAD(P)-dependent dehydrogenase (short-subunit alcohol dehydrogenase family)